MESAEMQNNDNASIICSNHVMLFCVYCSILIRELLYQLSNWYLIAISIFILILSARTWNQTKKAFIYRVSVSVCLSVYLTVSTSLCSPACPCMMLAHYRPQHFVYLFHNWCSDFSYHKTLSNWLWLGHASFLLTMQNKEAHVFYIFTFLKAFLMFRAFIL